MVCAKSFTTGASIAECVSEKEHRGGHPSPGDKPNVELAEIRRHRPMLDAEKS